MASEPLNRLVRATVVSIIGLREVYRVGAGVSTGTAGFASGYSFRLAFDQHGGGTRFANWKLDVGYCGRDG